jgi:hypothetical protein
MAIPDWARIGVQVVCIRDAWVFHPAIPHLIFPVLHMVYTIRSAAMFCECGKYFDPQYAYLRFEEIKNDPVKCSVGVCLRRCEPEFNHIRFRPVKKTSIDLLLPASVDPILSRPKKPELV